MTIRDPQDTLLLLSLVALAVLLAVRGVDYAEVVVSAVVAAVATKIGTTGAHPGGSDG
jgi:hypothetical protein